MSILLTEEIREIVGSYYKECNEANPPKIVLAMEIAERVAKAQLKNVADWGDEPCPHVFTCRGKHWCGECWEALLKEIK